MDANKAKRVFLFGLDSYFQELLQKVDSINPTSKASGQIEQLYATLLSAAAECTPTVVDRNHKEPLRLPVTPGTDFYFRTCPLVHEGPAELIGILALDVAQLPEGFRASVDSSLHGAPESLLPVRLLTFILTKGEGVAFQRSMLLATTNREGSFIPVPHSFQWRVSGQIIGGEDLTDTAEQEADRLSFLLDLVLRENATEPSNMPASASEQKKWCYTMDSTLTEMMLRELEKELPGIDLFSREFLFDKKYALSRSKVLIFGSPAGSRSRLSFLLRDAMTDERRETLFPGHYDLGNLRSRPPEFCTFDHSTTTGVASLAGELSAELENTGQLGSDESLDANSFKKLKKDLATLTGRSMEQHCAVNKSTALKVTKLLYRLGRDRWSSDPEPMKDKKGKFQLFAFLRWPQDGESDPYSLSLRDMFPYRSSVPKSDSKASEELSALFSDLKSYLSIELDDNTYVAISEVPQALHWHINNIERNIEKLLTDTGRSGYWDAVKTYGYLADRIDLAPRFDVPIAEIALDEDLFLYLHTLEFAHFAEAYPKLLEKAEPTCVLVPVTSVIDMLVKEITSDETLGMYDPFITDDEFHVFVSDWEELLCAIVGKALQEEITKTSLKRTIEPALHLAQTYALFRKPPSKENDPFTFSLLELVAALCCVRNEQSKKASDRTVHKPYWKGQQAQGGSILNSLRTSPWDSHPADSFDPIPEEHRLIWTNRFEWFLDALQEHTELTVQRFRFRSALARKAKAIVKTNNRDGMIDAMEKLGKLTFELGMHFLLGEEELHPDQ